MNYIDNSRVNYFISNVLTSSLLGDVADVVGNNNNKLTFRIKFDKIMEIRLQFSRPVGVFEVRPATQI